MKRIMLALLGALAAAAAIVPASAADIFGNQGLKDEAASGGIHWTGLYIGGVAGFGTGDASTTLSVPGQSLTGDNDVDGGIYGAHIGYNVQRGTFVLGVEGGLYTTDLNSDSASLLLPVAHETEIDWYGRLVARAGITSGSTLFYGFGGLAVGDVQSTLSGGGQSIKLSDEQHIGWTAGVGIEHQIGYGWIARAEYGHVDLGDENSGLDVGGATIDVNQDLSWDQVTFGFSKRF